MALLHPALALFMVGGQDLLKLFPQKQPKSIHRPPSRSILCPSVCGYLHAWNGRRSPSRKTEIHRCTRPQRGVLNQSSSFCRRRCPSLLQQWKQNATASCSTIRACGDRESLDPRWSKCQCLGSQRPVPTATWLRLLARDTSRATGGIPLDHFKCGF